MAKVIQKIRNFSRSRWLHEMELGVLVAMFVILCRHSQQLLRLLGPEATWGGLTILQIWNYGFDYVVASCVLAVTGIVAVAIADQRLKKSSILPLQDLARCVEAAAAGDLTARPSTELTGEAQRLGIAIGRLVGVLGRSEDLVYHLSTLVENSSDAIISLTPDGSISSWNKGAQRIYGFSSADVKGKHIAILMGADQGAQMAQLLETIQRGERVPPFEATHTAKSGRSVTALVRLSAIYDSTRLVIGASFCAQDLTDSGLRAGNSNISQAA